MDSSVDCAFSSDFVASGKTSEWTREWTQNALWRGLLILFGFCMCSSRFESWLGPLGDHGQAEYVVFPMVL